MKLVYKGIYKNKDQLPKGVLPENAVKFKEPNSMLMVNIVGIAYGIATLIIFTVIAAFVNKIFGIDRNINITQNTWGFVFALVCALPHELLHAVCFGKNAEVELWLSPKSFMAFVVSTHPVSKWRFVFISLCPQLVLGWLPFAVWLIFPNIPFGSFLYSFAAFSILFGCADDINIFNAMFQMPKGSMQQMSGFSSYWFMP